jgi:hypothetical protein
MILSITTPCHYANLIKHVFAEVGLSSITEQSGFFADLDGLVAVLPGLAALHSALEGAVAEFVERVEPVASVIKLFTVVSYDFS